MSPFGVTYLVGAGVVVVGGWGLAAYSCAATGKSVWDNDGFSLGAPIGLGLMWPLAIAFGVLAGVWWLVTALPRRLGRRARRKKLEAQKRARVLNASVEELVEEELKK